MIMSPELKEPRAGVVRRRGIGLHQGQVALSVPQTEVTLPWGEELRVVLPNGCHFSIYARSDQRIVGSLSGDTIDAKSHGTVLITDQGIVPCTQTD